VETLLVQLFSILANVVKQIISKEGLLFTNKSVLKCGTEGCCCLMALEVIFSNPVLQNDFLSTPDIVESKINTRKKRKKISLDSNLLTCNLITTVLKIKPHLLDVPFIKFYFGKTVAVLTAPDISLSSLSGMMHVVLINPQSKVSGVCIY